MEAVRTCASLLVPNLLPPTIFTTPFAQFSAASAQLVGEVVGKLLTVGITDQGERKEESLAAVTGNSNQGPSEYNCCLLFHSFLSSRFYFVLFRFPLSSFLFLLHTTCNVS